MKYAKGLEVLEVTGCYRLRDEALSRLVFAAQVGCGGMGQCMVGQGAVGLGRVGRGAMGLGRDGVK